MKTSLLSKAAVISTGLIVAGLLPSSAFAGPGPQYWQQQQEKARAENSAKAADASKMSVTASHLCTGAQIVPVTVMKPSWSNGRGPLAEVQLGTKTVCHICPVTTIVTKNAWSNGRGPVTRTEVTQTGVEHTCTACVVALK